MNNHEKENFSSERAAGQTLAAKPKGKVYKRQAKASEKQEHLMSKKILVKQEHKVAFR